MIALIPVSRFRIDYEVAAGRPFSRLEQLILRAIKDGTTELSELQRVFEIPQRLLIEGLVTLTHAGWLAVGGHGREGFVLTSEGDKAAGSDGPPSTITVESRQTYVVMERMTGALLHKDDVRYATRKDLDKVWDAAIRLPADFLDNRLDEGQVQHLLPRRKGEWVRWIGPIDMVSKGANWVPVNVDPDDGVVAGLPDTWLHRLRPDILDVARRFARTSGSNNKATTWKTNRSRNRSSSTNDTDSDVPRLPTSSWATTISATDLAFSYYEHEQLLVAALAEGRSIFVASAFINVETLEALAPKFEAALIRGATIDLLWGQGREGNGPGHEVVTIEWFKKLAYSSRHNKWQGQLRFNHAPSSSHANLLLWDTTLGFQACVGSYNWLSATVRDKGSRNVTIRIAQPAAVAALARCAATLWTGAATEMLANTGDRWKRIAGELDRTAAEDDKPVGNATIRLVLDRDHAQLLREWCATAQQRLVIASRWMSLGSDERYLGAEVERTTDFAFEIIYGQTEADGALLDRISATVNRSQGLLKFMPKFHANFVISDVSTCVASYNFLSSASLGTIRNTREVGLVIDSAEVAEWVIAGTNRADEV